MDDNRDTEIRSLVKYAYNLFLQDSCIWGNILLKNTLASYMIMPKILAVSKFKVKHKITCDLTFRISVIVAKCL